MCLGIARIDRHWDYLHTLLYSTSSADRSEIIIGLVNSGLLHLQYLVVELLIRGNLLQCALVHGEDVLLVPVL